MAVTPCRDCLARLEDTEVLTEAERYVAEDEWEVDYSDLQASAKRGCPVCVIHLRVISRGHQPGANSAANKSRSNKVLISHRWLARGEITETITDITSLTVSGETYEIYTDREDACADLISNRRERPPKDSEESFSKIQQWITGCVNGHGRSRDHCRETGNHSATLLPPRVIQITKTPEDKLHAKLVEPHGTKARYVTLSYCWGEDRWNPLRTTTQNHKQHLTSIPIATAPQTIRDAITATSRLDLEYLWIDSLCIIQDSQADKNIQLAQMGNIYEQAFVTIVAASGEHASYGFLAMPPTSKPVEFKLPLPSFFTGRHGTLYTLKGDSEEHMRGQAINRRAWTFQERLLSRRKLIFLADRVTWECRSISTIEMGEAVNVSEDFRIMPEILDGSSKPSLDSDPAVSSGGPSAGAQKKHSQIMWVGLPEWMKTVEWYSPRSVSWPSDKLRAIGGMAQKYQTTIFIGHAYLAGLWTGFILQGLLWRRITQDGEALHPRPSEYRSPTWSWAAIDGAVQYEQMDYEEGSFEVARLGHEHSIVTRIKPTVLDASVQLSEPSQPFWGISGGRISLSGHVKHVRGRLQRSLSEDYGQTLNMHVLDDDGGPAAVLKGGAAVVTSPPSLDKPSGLLQCWPDAVGDLSEGDDVELHLLAVTGLAELVPSPGGFAGTRSRGSRARAQYRFIVRGLILAQRGVGVHSRLGFFEYSDSSFEGLMRGFDRQSLDVV